MKKIIIAFILFVVFSQLASGEELEMGTQEFEFELTDVFYPLLTKEESAELSKEMIKNARVNIYYSGKSKDIIVSPLGWVIATIYSSGRWTPPIIQESEEGEWEKPQSVDVKDGKLRIKVDKSADMTHINPIAIMTNSFNLSKIRIYLPIYYITKILNEEILYKNDRYLKFDIYTENDSELYKKGYEYAKSEYLTPIENGVVVYDSAAFLGLRYGMQFYATGKLSIVQNDKAVLADDKPPLVDKTEKMYAISSGKQTQIADTINMNKIKGLPKNVADVKARYLKRKRLEQFTLYGNVKYKNEKGNDDILANFFLNQIKTHGKLYRIDASVNDHEVKYYDKTEIDWAEAACAFGYGIEFYENEEIRYFNASENDENFFDWSVKGGIEYNITQDNLTPILEYEKRLETHLKDKPNGKEKMAACKELLSYAKHILSAPKAKLEKEFDEQYKIIGTEYQKVSKNGFYVGKANGTGTMRYPDGSIFAGNFWDGKVVSGNMFYPNGNYIFIDDAQDGEIKGLGELYLSPQIKCVGYFENGTMNKEGYIYFDDKKGNKNHYGGIFKNGVIEEKAYASIETKMFSAAIDELPCNSKKQEKLIITPKNGKLEGEAYMRIYKKDKMLICQAVTFENGKIVQNVGISDKQLKIIEKYLEKLYHVKCDVNYTVKKESY
ncbi:MAG: hypothetical protein LBJ88_05295 [Campylobacteraceae bacterium]|jgi:hypothetical protein|nr:hypothetical protein [Campylobacteraceae bacterium]